MFAGGFANGVERIIYGYVRDFIYVTFYTNFNIADSFVVVGAAIIVIYLIFFYSSDSKKKVGAAAEPAISNLDAENQEHASGETTDIQTKNDKENGSDL
jgi:hypothetical protein